MEARHWLKSCYYAEGSKQFVMLSSPLCLVGDAEEGQELRTILHAWLDSDFYCPMISRPQFSSELKDCSIREEWTDMLKGNSSRKHLNWQMGTEVGKLHKAVHFPPWLPLKTLILHSGVKWTSLFILETIDLKVLWTKEHPLVLINNLQTYV